MSWAETDAKMGLCFQVAYELVDLRWLGSYTDNSIWVIHRVGTAQLLS